LKENKETVTVVAIFAVALFIAYLLDTTNLMYIIIIAVITAVVFLGYGWFIRWMNLDTIKQKLQALREGSEEYDYYLRNLREELTEGGFKLKDIKTTEEELDQLRVKGCKTVAEKHLENLRQRTIEKHFENIQHEMFNYRFALKTLREKTAEGGFNLEYINTNDVELEQLRIKNCKISAREWFESLQGELTSGDFEYNIGGLYSELRAGKITLKDINTSRKEVKQLRIENYKLSVKSWLELIREYGFDGYGDREFLRNLRKKVIKYNFELEEVGASESELWELKRKGKQRRNNNM